MGWVMRCRGGIKGYVGEIASEYGGGFLMDAWRTDGRRGFELRANGRQVKYLGHPRGQAFLLLVPLLLVLSNSKPKANTKMR